MTHDFRPWTPPPGAVVAPPVHAMTRVLCMWSDGAQDDVWRFAGDTNWSSVGDGPSVVAYAIVQKDKPAPGVDLTEITTPFGLLDQATREALEAHGGPYECFGQHDIDYRWQPPASRLMTFDSHPAIAWRVKPDEAVTEARDEYKEPPKVAREWWIDGAGFSFTSDEVAHECGRQPIIHVREVPEPSSEVVAPRAMKAIWNDRRNCFEIYVTNVDYRDGTTMTVFGDLP